MGKPWKRVKPKREKPLSGPCFVKGCPHRGGQQHACVLCERAVAEGKREEPFTVAFCVLHTHEAGVRVKSHVLLRHPGTLLAFAGEVLRGRPLSKKPDRFG